jgi:hypothetical protein
MQAPPPYEAVMVEAHALPLYPPHYFEEELIELKKKVASNEMQNYDLYLDLKRDIENIHKEYKEEISNMTSKISKLENEVAILKGNIHESTLEEGELLSFESFFEEVTPTHKSPIHQLSSTINDKLRMMKLFIDALDKYTPIEVGTDVSRKDEFGYKFIRQSVYDDVQRRGYDLSEFRKAGWISYRFPIPNSIYTNELGNGYSGLLDITRNAIPILIEIQNSQSYGLNASWLIEIFTCTEGTPGVFTWEAYRKNTFFNSQTSISYYYGGSYPKDIVDFTSIAGGKTSHRNMQTLTYFDSKITNLLHYFKECVKIKVPRFIDYCKSKNITGF